MTDLILSLTVPYAGKDRVVSGSPTNIAKAATMIASGLPTIADMNISQELADMDTGGATEMAMGNGRGREFIRGDHLLLMALSRVC